jgi:hypothetical protein
MRSLILIAMILLAGCTAAPAPAPDRERAGEARAVSHEPKARPGGGW